MYKTGILGPLQRIQPEKINKSRGMDLELPDPHCHDVIIENNGSLDHFLGKAERLLNMIEVEIESLLVRGRLLLR